MRRPLDIGPWLPRHQWPKIAKPLTEEGRKIHGDFIKLWLQTLPTKKYGLIETFNLTYPLRFLPEVRPFRTIEIGAGIGTHLVYEDLSIQSYHCVELRESLCAGAFPASP
jgi:hypothetical protein